MSDLKKEEYILWFSELGKEDIVLAGGKGANLGEMYNSKMPVPPGFVITTKAYELFLENTGLSKQIKEKLVGLDEEDTDKIEEIGKEIRDLIEVEKIPDEVEAEILEAYENLSIDKESLKQASKDALAILSKGFDLSFVAVRSSATAEDSLETSFAGQNQTFLNIKGKKALLKAVKSCWKSLFTNRSLYYQIKNKLIDKNILIAVIIQQMINSDKSGVIFTKDPINNNDNLVIEAVFGLGEGIVSGKIKPDNYVIDRNMEIKEKKLADKKIALIRNSSGETEQVTLTEERSKSQVLSDYEIKKLADYALQLEEHYGKPQDIEFAIDSGVIYIVQTRPITTLGKTRKIKQKAAEVEETEKEVILTGLAASPGVALGVVKIIRDVSELNKLSKGDVLVTKMTNPDMVVAMQKASAIITDEGGLTSHAAIVSREMGIPAVVGTDEATEVLKDGDEVTVDGSNGKVYFGETKIKSEKLEIEPVISTKIKIKIIVDLPNFAKRASETGIREVGLTRIEGIIAESGKHPYLFLKQKRVKDYEEIIYSGISRIAKYFDKLWIRTSDIRSDEYSNLPGAPEKEGNPMLGMHGIRDSLIHIDLFKAELNALKRVSDEGKQIGILLPQIISVDELKKVKEILKEISFNEVKLGVMVETPASVMIIEDLCKEGIDFISFGTNDLTQYTLAVDRNNEDVQYLYDEMNPAVLSQLAKVIGVCKKYNVETSICGQAGSKKPMVEFLFKKGIDSISVNADVAGEISRFIASLEKEEPEKKFRESKEEKIEEKRGNKDETQKKYDIICSNCGKKASVPFKPDGVRPVYCKECYKLGKKGREKQKQEEKLN